MIIPPGFIAVFARFTNQSGHSCQSVMGYSIGSIFDQTNADFVSDTLATAYKAQLGTGSRWVGVHVLIGNDGPLGEVNSASSAGNGSRSGDLVSPQVQGLLSKKTAFTGRRNRGRMFVPDMSEAQVDNGGQINSGGRALLQDIANAWFVAVPAGSGSIDAAVILHTDSTAPTPVTTFNAEAMVATLRNRYIRAA